MKLTRFLALLLPALFCGVSANRAAADTFGSGANAFDIEFVTIGNPGNAADTTGVPIPPYPTGSVAKTYRIGKFEISEQMIDKANALGGLGITKDIRGSDKPATNVSWFEAIKFVNWLNTSTGSTPAYRVNGSGNFQLWQPSDAGYNPDNLYRNSLAKYFLPSVDEWYKAAYYDPTSGVYNNFPTGSNPVPDGIDFAGDPNFDAVFSDHYFNPQLNDIANVGVLSPYGTAGQGGNVWEWEETEFDLVNNSISSARGIRGGNWDSNFDSLSSSSRFNIFPAFGFDFIGLRVASIAIPEPSTLAILGMGFVGVLGLLLRRRSR